MKLDLYFANRFLRAFAMVGGIFVGLIVMIEYLEQLRRFSSAGIGAADYLVMAMLRLPVMLYEILALIVVISTLVMYLGLARSSELVVARASGRSALRSLLAPVLTVFLIGLLTVAVLNPVSVAAKRAYEDRVTLYKEGDQRVFSISDEGLWLREGSAEGQTLIRASRSNLNGSRLYDVTFLSFEKSGAPVSRIEARAAQITHGNWALTDAKFWPLRDAENPEGEAETYESLELPTSLTNEEIQDRFAASDAVSVWDMSAHIEKLDAAGFSALSFRMQMQTEFTLPLTFVAMMMIGAGLTMKHTRFGGTSSSVITAIILAFSFFFLRSFAAVLGQNGELPIHLAAWAPPLAVICASLALLLHLEDG